MIYEIKNEHLKARISSLGAELISVLGDGGYEYIWQGERFWHSHAPVLFPLCGRIKDERYTYHGKEYSMKLHGLAMYSEFTVKEMTDSSIELVFSSDESTKEKYPFDFTLTVKFALDGKKLNAAFTVSNDGEDVLPYMIGWHPGINLDPSVEIEDYYLDFGKEAALRLHPVKDRKFILSSTVPFVTEDGKYRIREDELDDYDTLVLEGTSYFVRLASDKPAHSVVLRWSDNIPNFCVWRMPLVNAPYLCLEPWSNLPGDGVSDEHFETRDMLRLQKGEKSEFLFETEFD